MYENQASGLLRYRYIQNCSLPKTTFLPNKCFVFADLTLMVARKREQGGQLLHCLLIFNG